MQICRTFRSIFKFDMALPGLGEALKHEITCEPPRVYRRVKLSEDGPYDTKKTYSDLHG